MKLGVVVQRYGADINGGAELHARYIAERLARKHDVEVLTTCAHDYVTWRNEYPAGEERIGPVQVRRFQVSRERDPDDFGRKSFAVFETPHDRLRRRSPSPYAWVLLTGTMRSICFSCADDISRPPSRAERKVFRSRVLEMTAPALCALTLAILLLWPKLSTRVPAPFVALVVTTALARLLHLPVETIGDRFGPGLFISLFLGLGGACRHQQQHEQQVSPHDFSFRLARLRRSAIHFTTSVSSGASRLYAW